MSVSFTSSVASGDVVLVGVFSGSSISITVGSVSDSLSSSFTQAVTSSNLIGGEFLYVYIYYATLSSSGSDQITVTFSSPPTQYSTVFYVFIYEVSGVTTTGATTGTGAGDYGAPVSTTSTAFQSGAFLLGIIGNNIMSTGVTPGSGFTLTPDDSASQILGISHVEYSTSGVSSPTTFPATFSQSNRWVEAGIALDAEPQISLSPIFGPPGTIVTVTGSGFIVSAQPYCDFVSSPAGLVGPTRGTDFVCNIDNTGSVATSWFVVAAGASGSYSVTVSYFGQASAPVQFTVSQPQRPPVGGVVVPVNTFAILGPWLTVIALVGCIGTVVAVAKSWKKREN
jgi:hypothetical protein